MKKILLILMLVLSFSLLSCDKGSDSEWISMFEDGIIAAYKDNKCGYIDKAGEEKIPFTYEQCGRFYDDEAIVMVGERAKLINTSGDSVLTKDYDRLFRDEVNKNVLYYENDKWGIMDKDGNKITEAIYDTILNSPNGWYVVKTDGVAKFIDEEGEDVFDLEFEAAYYFFNGLAAVKKDGKNGFINEEGDLVIDYQYDYVSAKFDEFDRNIVVEVGDEGQNNYHLINKENEKVIENAYRITGSGPLYAVQFEFDGDTKIYDSEGNLFSDESFYSVTSIRGRFLSVLDDAYTSKNVFLNEDGTINVIADAMGKSHIYYREVAGEIVNYMVVKNESGLTLYTEEEIFTLELDDFLMILDGDLFIGVRDNLYGLIDKEGNILLDFEYDMLTFANDEYYMFIKNDLMGLMDQDFEIVIDLEYERIYSQLNIYTLITY